MLCPLSTFLDLILGFHNIYFNFIFYLFYYFIYYYYYFFFLQRLVPPRLRDRPCQGPPGGAGK